MLEGVQVDFVVCQGVIWRHVVGELHQLQVDVLRLQGLLGRLPQVLVNGPHHAQLDGDGLGSGGVSGGLGAAGGRGQGEQNCGKDKGNCILEFHDRFLLIGRLKCRTYRVRDSLKFSSMVAQEAANRACSSGASFSSMISATPWRFSRAGTLA